MKEISEIPGKELNNIIAKRLKNIRLELQEKDPKYTQTYIAKKVGSRQKYVSRLERYDLPTSVVSKDLLIKLLIYYNNLGYNMEWILKPNNQDINKYVLTIS